MSKERPVLSIAIPTFNRAAELERQLRWALSATAMHQESVEIVVSDNASTDATPEIVANLCSNGRQVRSVRQPRNLGIVGNYRYCLEVARSKFVWVVGDDDPISDEAVPKILQILGQHPSVGLIHMNHRCMEASTGQCVHARLYSVSQDRWTEQGGELFEQLLLEQEGGFLFLTANIVRRDLAIEAMREWPWRQNLAVTTFVHYSCSVGGGLQYLGSPLCDCVYGASSWSEDSFLMHYVHLPFAYYALRKRGLSMTTVARLLSRRLDGSVIRGLGSYLFHRAIRAMEGREKTW